MEILVSYHRWTPSDCLSLWQMGCRDTPRAPKNSKRQEAIFWILYVIGRNIHASLSPGNTLGMTSITVRYQNLLGHLMKQWYTMRFINGQSTIIKHTLDKVYIASFLMTEHLHMLRWCGPIPRFSLRFKVFLLHNIDHLLILFDALDRTLEGVLSLWTRAY